jgi:hypothetical protein
MSNLAWLIIIVISLNVVGSLVLGLTAKHYYWEPRKGLPQKNYQSKD